MYVQKSRDGINPPTGLWLKVASLVLELVIAEDEFRAESRKCHSRWDLDCSGDHLTYGGRQGKGKGKDGRPKSFRVNEKNLCVRDSFNGRIVKK